MKFTETEIKDVILIEPAVFPDGRGYFYESYSEKKFKDAGLDINFVQDNVSKSRKGTIRGLHYQVGGFAQGKLCEVLYGKVTDVAVDIRFGSPTFGKFFQTELSDENHNLIWIPQGFAHGFAALSDEVVFHYKCTASYSKKDERSIIFNDSELNIDWGVEYLAVSHKDLNSKKFSDIEKDFTY
jgi:dTDP-4-dehydrorhamnose 3,5-epimerase